MACHWCWSRSKPARLVPSRKGLEPAKRGGARSTKIFVDNTKTFVLSSAHDERTSAKANDFRAGNPASAVGARTLYGPRSARIAERKEGPRLHHRPEAAANNDRQGQRAQKRRPARPRLRGMPAGDGDQAAARRRRPAEGISGLGKRINDPRAGRPANVQERAGGVAAPSGRI